MEYSHRKQIQCFSKLTFSIISWQKKNMLTQQLIIIHKEKKITKQFFKLYKSALNLKIVGNHVILKIKGYM